VPQINDMGLGNTEGCWLSKISSEVSYSLTQLCTVYRLTQVLYLLQSVTVHPTYFERLV
jgi:hypothetical protein